MPETDFAVEPAHPFRAFWESGELEVWIDALAPDVELHSPLITAPFRGRLFEFGEVPLQWHRRDPQNPSTSSGG